MLQGSDQYQPIVLVPFISVLSTRRGGDTSAPHLWPLLPWYRRDGAGARCLAAPRHAVQRSFVPVAGRQPVRDSVYIQYDLMRPSLGTDVPARVHSLDRRR